MLDNMFIQSWAYWVTYLCNLFVDACEFELGEWAARKVEYRMLKSSTWEVRGIAMCAVYQVISPWGIHIVDFLKNECSCRSVLKIGCYLMHKSVILCLTSYCV